MHTYSEDDDDLDDEEFEEFVGDLAEEWRKKGVWQLSRACLTKPRTREGSAWSWIINDRPQVNDHYYGCCGYFHLWIITIICKHY